MFNMLPQSEKQMIKREYLRRYVAVTLFFMFGLITFASITLVPSYIMSNVKEKILSGQIDAAKNTLSATEESQATKDIRNITEEIRVLAPGAMGVNNHDVFLSIVTNKNVGIKITSMALVRGNAETAVTVSGIASDRQTLLSFEKKLNENTLFSNVDLPISNLTKNKDISFTVKLKGKF